MLDLSKFTEAVSTLIGGGAVQDLLSNTDLMEVVAQSGLSLEDLQALDTDSLIGLLNSQGIDAAGLAPEQLQQVTEAISSGSISDLFNR